MMVLMKMECEISENSYILAKELGKFIDIFQISASGENADLHNEYQGFTRQAAPMNVLRVSLTSPAVYATVYLRQKLSKSISASVKQIILLFWSLHKIWDSAVD